MDAIEKYLAQWQALLLIVLKLRVLLPESLIISGMHPREISYGKKDGWNWLKILSHGGFCTFWCCNLKCHFLYTHKTLS
jgi:hypothetical protein